MSKMSFLRPEIEKRRLIELVRSNPILWDCRLPHYKRSDKKKALKWNELGRIFSVSGERLQRTFTSLREIFRREFNNEKLLGKSFASKWEYYDAMAFLKGVIRERKSRERLKSLPNQRNDGVNHENEQNIIDEYQYFAPNDPNNPNNCNQTILQQQQQQQQQSSILQNQLENTINTTTTITTILPVLIKKNKSQRQHNNDNEQRNIIDEYQYFSPTDPNNPNNFNETLIQLQQQQQQQEQQQQQSESNLEKSTPPLTTTTTPIIQIQQKLQNSAQFKQQQQQQPPQQYNETNLQENTLHQSNINNDNNNNIQHENHLNGLQTLSNLSAQQPAYLQQTPTSQTVQQQQQQQQKPQQLIPTAIININNQLNNQEHTLVQQSKIATKTKETSTSSVERIINNTPTYIHTLNSSSSSPSIYIKSEIDSHDEESIDDIDGLTEASLVEEPINPDNNIMYNLRNIPNLQQHQQQQQKMHKNSNNNLENLGNQSQRSLEPIRNNSNSSLYAQRSGLATTHVKSQTHRISNNNKNNNNNNTNLNIKSSEQSNGHNFVTDMHIDLDMDEDVDVDVDSADIHNGERYSLNSNLNFDPLSGQQGTSAREVLFARFADFLAARLNTLSEQVAHDLMNNILMLIAEQ